MQENKNKYYDIAERIYDLDGEVYECVGSSLAVPLQEINVPVWTIWLC